MGFLSSLFSKKELEAEMLADVLPVAEQARRILGLSFLEANSVLNRMIGGVFRKGGGGAYGRYHWAWVGHTPSGISVMFYGSARDEIVDFYELHFPKIYSGLSVMGSRKHDGSFEETVTGDIERALSADGLRLGNAISTATGWPFFKR